MEEINEKRLLEEILSPSDEKNFASRSHMRLGDSLKETCTCMSFCDVLVAVTEASLLEIFIIG